MGKQIGAVVAGFVIWSVLHLLNIFLVRSIWPDAIGADGSCFETLPLAVTLFLTMDQSLVAGIMCRVIAKKGKAPLALAITLTVVGAVIEGANWKLAPAWYHIGFLVMLTPMTLLGALLAAKKQS